MPTRASVIGMPGGGRVLDVGAQRHAFAHLAPGSSSSSVDHGDLGAWLTWRAAASGTSIDDAVGQRPRPPSSRSSIVFLPGASVLARSFEDERVAAALVELDRAGVLAVDDERGAPADCVIWRACSAYAVSALSAEDGRLRRAPRAVAAALVVEPLDARADLRLVLAVGDALSSASTASDVVSIVSESPPDSGDRCAWLRRSCRPSPASPRAASPSPSAVGALRPTSTVVFVASASRYGSRGLAAERASAPRAPSSRSAVRFASASAHVM